MTVVKCSKLLIKQFGDAFAGVATPKMMKGKEGQQTVGDLLVKTNTLIACFFKQSMNIK